MKNETLTADEGLKEINKFFAAPVLVSESRLGYAGISRRFIEIIKPREFIELMLVKDLVDATWEMKRYSSYKMCVIELEYNRNLEHELKPDMLKLRRLEDAFKSQQEKQAEEAKKAKEAEKPTDGEKPKEAAAVGETDQAEQVDQADAPPNQSKRMLELDVKRIQHAGRLMSCSASLADIIPVKHLEN